MDPYARLSLVKPTTLVLLKGAYRREAKKYHPDINPGHEAQFLAVRSAYEQIEAQLKLGTVVPPAAPPQEAQPKNTEPKDTAAVEPARRARRPSSPFATFQRAAVGPGLRERLDLSLEEACLGTTVTVRHPSGSETVVIPPGILSGTILVVKGVIPGASLGMRDLHVSVHIRPHTRFRRDGNDLIMILRIPPAVAASGAERQVTGLDGAQTWLKIPMGAQDGQVLRLPRKGVPMGRSARGDLLVELRVGL